MNTDHLDKMTVLGRDLATVTGQMQGLARDLYGEALAKICSERTQRAEHMKPVAVADLAPSLADMAMSLLEIANREESRSRIVMSAEDAFIGL